MKKKMYKLFIFDVDGTLLDTSEGLLKSTISAIRELQYPMPSDEVLRSFVGPRIQDSFQRVYGLQGKELDRAAGVFRAHYKAGDVLLAKPYDGVYEVLRELKRDGGHVAAATNKRQDFADQLLEKYQLTPYIEFVCGTDLAGKLTKPDLIRRCMQQFPDCSQEETVMIGDSAYDAKAAQEVGIDFAGVTFGFDFRSREDIKQWPVVGCADSFYQLKELLVRDRRDGKSSEMGK